LHRQSHTRTGRRSPSGLSTFSRNERLADSRPVALLLERQVTVASPPLFGPAPMRVGVVVGSRRPSERRTEAAAEMDSATRTQRGSDHQAVVGDPICSGAPRPAFCLADPSDSINRRDRQGAKSRRRGSWLHDQKPRCRASARMNPGTMSGHRSRDPQWLSAETHRRMRSAISLLKQP